MDSRALRSFVVEAHRNGYATADGERADDGATIIEYRDGNWRYRDRYYGSRQYVGAEVVHFEGEPVWGMHYSGAPTEPTADHEALYEFLREALATVSLERPFRGPDRYADGGLEYRSSVEGTVSRFRGTETIRRDDTCTYRGQFGGGAID